MCITFVLEQELCLHWHFIIKGLWQPVLQWGEGPVIRAGVEILKMEKFHELPARAKYDRIIEEAKEK